MFLFSANIIKMCVALLLIQTELVSTKFSSYTYLVTIFIDDIVEQQQIYAII